MHRVLERKGFRRLQNGRGKKTEWSRCPVKDVEAAVLSVKNGWENSENRIASFSMLLEQERAVGKRLGILLCSRQRIARRSPCGARRCASEGVCNLWAGEADRAPPYSGADIQSGRGISLARGSAVLRRFRRMTVLFA